jgi:hypothetical protein
MLARRVRLLSKRGAKKKRPLQWGRSLECPIKLA